MLKQTFIHLPRVGYETERRLWREGLRDWEQALDCSVPPPGFSRARWDDLRRYLEDSRRSLERRDHRHFATALAPVDHWRAFPDFSARVAYLDIETTGTGAWSQVTVIGLYDGQTMRTYVAGENLQDFGEDIQSFALLVTFNGATFDLPFLRRLFRDFPQDVLHVDLRYALRRLGLSGGLKAIEQRLGLSREPDLQGLDGYDAVLLWQAHCSGDPAALDVLCRYNAADVQNLEVLAKYAYPRLWRQAGGVLEARGERREARGERREGSR
jgi:uncharacterized protein YprB with RNaseH-like and TPR domain